MENTLENKAKFFAQYWGQEVLQIGISDLLECRPESLTNRGYYNLCLKPISLITDKDLIEVARIMSYYSDEIIIERRENEIWCICDAYIKVVVGIINFGLIGLMIDGEPSDINKQFKLYVNYCEDEIITVIDYLRSKGYALPWMGLSVETLVEYGWVKLTENV